MSRCPRCQGENEEDSRFCRHCGQAMAEDSSPDDEDTLIIRLLQAEPLPGPAAGANPRIWLLDPTGEQVEHCWELEGVSTIGRRPDCQIVLPSNTVSRRHSQIRLQDGRCLLSDLGSTNGTFLNGEPVIGEEQLSDRDEIRVGVFKLIFRCG